MYPRVKGALHVLALYLYSAAAVSKPSLLEKWVSFL